jgi:RNA polymerase sporulation-specific sigma factor
MKRDEFEEATRRIQSVATALGIQWDKWDEALGEGMLAVVEARERFDDSFGVSFWTFATYRVRGRLIDRILRRVVLVNDGEVDEDEHAASVETQAQVLEIYRRASDADKEVLVALLLTRGDVSKTARVLCVSRPTVYTAMRRLRGEA